MSTLSKIVVIVLFPPVITLQAAAQDLAKATVIPHLERRGSSTQLIVDGNPFLILGGELHNSSASSLAYMKPIWPRLASMHLNTVLTPISWELVEPEEGKFDFTLVDGLVRDARQHQLRLVLLWFGSWKNTYSSYTPAWVKKNLERFPRVQTRDGRGTERLSPFSEANRDADARAFAALMRHLRQIDGDAHTVIMVQVENEVGVIPDSRDRSVIADKAFVASISRELSNYLEQHKDALIPEFRAVWEAMGSRTSGTWEELFGKGALTDDLFMAWAYARYVNYVVAKGKAEYPLPMFVNAALIRPNYEPGQYNSGGPLPHSIDIWRAGGPNIDFFAPDIYFENFAEWSLKYHRAGNPLFVPEAIGGAAGAANAFYAFGQQQAIGFSPFGIDAEEETALQQRNGERGRSLEGSYAVLSRLAPLIIQKQAEGKIAGVVLEGESQRAARVSLGDYTMTVLRATSETNRAERGAAMFIVSGPDEYVIAGSGSLTVAFTPNTPGLPTAGIASIDEEILVDGQWIPGRRLNGDENAQGQLLRLNASDREHSVIYRVRLYRYR